MIKDNRLDLRLSTDQLGVAALTVHADSTWYTEHPLWLVENQALFDQLDWLPCAQPASVAYYSGHRPTFCWIGSPCASGRLRSTSFPTTTEWVCSTLPGFA